MKNIKILETLVGCVFVVMLLCFAVMPEHHNQAAQGNQARASNKPAVQQYTRAIRLSSARTSSLNMISFISLSRLFSSAVAFVVVVSLIILLVGILFYNIYSIRP